MQCGALEQILEQKEGKAGELVASKQELEFSSYHLVQSASVGFLAMEQTG